MLGGNGKVKKKVSRLEQVFMVGDNPESDIRNANEFESPYGTEWTSILVKTGVYSKGSKPKYAPKVIIKDVLEAVKWGLRKEGWNGVVD
jgi:ribonucleotide monophosphatase NagD (HAD superfamily)